jgi:SAM-dependent methyltransferase
MNLGGGSPINWGTSMTESRQPHAVLDLASRQWKALKIERLLKLDQCQGPLRLLEVGTGSGGIAHYFGAHPSGRFDVEAVDVVDNRLVSDGYRYTHVAETTLPFADESFDIVLSNHVIEHVGDEVAQMHHLSELRRVMKPDGVGYLAVPNRWMLVEPHYRLAFLSWWPRAWRTPYLRLTGKGERYDCEPLRLGELESMLDRSGLAAQNICLPAMRETLSIEVPGSFADRLLARIPDGLLYPLRRIIPTLIYRLERASV